MWLLPEEVLVLPLAGVATEFNEIEGVDALPEMLPTKHLKKINADVLKGEPPVGV